MAPIEKPRYNDEFVLYFGFLSRADLSKYYLMPQFLPEGKENEKKCSKYYIQQSSLYKTKWCPIEAFICETSCVRHFLAL